MVSTNQRESLTKVSRGFHQFVKYRPASRPSINVVSNKHDRQIGGSQRTKDATQPKRIPVNVANDGDRVALPHETGNVSEV